MNSGFVFQVVRFSISFPDLYSVFGVCLTSTAFGDFHVRQPVVASIDVKISADFGIHELKRIFIAYNKYIFDCQIGIALKVTTSALSVLMVLLTSYSDRRLKRGCATALHSAIIVATRQSVFLVRGLREKKKNPILQRFFSRGHWVRCRRI